MICICACSMASSAISLAVVWSVSVVTEPFSVRVTTRKVTAMKVMTERRIRVMTRATPRSEVGPRDNRPQDNRPQDNGLRTTGPRDNGLETGLRTTRPRTTGLRDHGLRNLKFGIFTDASFEGLRQR